VRELYEQAGAPNGQDGDIDFSKVPPAAGYDKLADIMTEVARLAALPELEYSRIRRDEAKRLGLTRVEDLDKAVKGLRPLGQAEITEKVQLIALGTELLELWHDGSEAWCWSKEHGPSCCWRMPSGEAKRCLLAAYGERHQATLDDGRKVPTTPGRQAVSESLDQFEAMAHDGPRRTAPGLRVAGDGSRLVLDLCRDDYSVVVVENGGWQVVKPSPLAMRRAPGMQPLPLPVQGAGDALGDLRRVLHFDDTAHASFWALYVGYMFAALRPVPPYFVLCITGEHGEGKSMTAKTVRIPVDPHDTDIQPKPRTEDDLFVNSDGQWLNAYDNLSKLDTYWSDAFCRVSTGTGYSKRKLHTDRDTARFRVARPQIINAIGDVVGAPDLLDRSLLAQQPTHAEPMPDEELLAAVEALAPRVLGQLLDAAAVALRDQAKIKLGSVPRMVGPTRWIEAGAAVLGLDAEQFLKAYLDSQAQAGHMALDASLIGGPLCDMLDGRDALVELAAKDPTGSPYTVPPLPCGRPDRPAVLHARRPAVPDL
jgi:hypothetical protein